MQERQTQDPLAPPGSGGCTSGLTATAAGLGSLGASRTLANAIASSTTAAGHPTATACRLIFTSVTPWRSASRTCWINSWDGVLSVCALENRAVPINMRTTPAELNCNFILISAIVAPTTSGVFPGARSRPSLSRSFRPALRTAHAPPARSEIANSRKSSRSLGYCRSLYSQKIASELLADQANSRPAITGRRSQYSTRIGRLKNEICQGTVCWS